MSIDALKSRLPAYAKDIKLNLGGLSTSAALTEQQLNGAILAAALASKNAEVIKAISEEVSSKLSEEALTATKAAAAIMAMNNIYYRSAHLLGGDYLTRPARLRMSVIANPGVDKVDFELWSLVVSAINGCGMCLKAHEKEVLEKGASKEAVQDALRVAAIVHAVASVLEGEDALT